jgi:hypothetical protein
MMTLKLVSHDGRVRIVEAASFTITEERFEIPGFCRKVSAHDLPIGNDDCWWVGVPPYEIDAYRVFEVAYIMNNSGKTVETIQRPLNLDPRAAQSSGMQSEIGRGDIPRAA